MSVSVNCGNKIEISSVLVQQCRFLLRQSYVIKLMYNNFIRKSCKHGLITKKCVAMHTSLTFKFKLAVYSSVLALKLLNVVESCFKPKICFDTEA